jgi:hypothetical protein
VFQPEVSVRREHPRARAISRRLRPSASRRRISSYRCTVMLRSAMLPSPSWLPTKVAAVRHRHPAMRAQKPENALSIDHQKNGRIGSPQSGDLAPPLAWATPKNHAYMVNRDIGGPLPCTGSTPKKGAAGGPQLRKSRGSDQRKFCNP